MKRTFTLGIAVLAVVLFAGMVYAALRLAHVAEPAATTVHGATPQRLWATGSVALALPGVILGTLGWARPHGRFGTRHGQIGAMVAGAVASINGGFVLAFATGGPGSGNGVVGGAAALVLGLTAIALGGWTLSRSASHEANAASGSSI